MSDPTRVVVLSGGPGGSGGDAAADEIAAGLRRHGLATERYVLAGGDGPPWAVPAEAAVARAVGADAAAVVSIGALSSRVAGRLRQRGTITAPVITYLAGAAVHPLAVAPGVDVHLAGTAVTAAQARALGAADVRVVAPPVHTEFAADGREDRAGLPEGRLALVLAAGAHGLDAAVRTSADIAATGLATPVVSCGGDEVLRRRLARSGAGIALGWVDDMAALLRSCDVVVQNAGGQVSIEALTAGVPVLSYRCVPGPGRANAAALEHAGLVPWIRRPEDLAAALGRVLDLPVPRPDTAGPSAAAVIAGLTGRPIQDQALPVRRIVTRRVRPLAAPALEHTV